MWAGWEGQMTCVFSLIIHVPLRWWCTNRDATQGHSTAPKCSFRKHLARKIKAIVTFTTQWWFFFPQRVWDQLELFIFIHWPLKGLPYVCLHPFFFSFFFLNRLTGFKTYSQLLFVSTKQSGEHAGIVKHQAMLRTKKWQKPNPGHNVTVASRWKAATLRPMMPK